ncbi:MAG: hypothetical protein ACI392_08575 [Paludibacteraceae bacterium]
MTNLQNSLITLIQRNTYSEFQCDLLNVIINDPLGNLDVLQRDIFLQSRNIRRISDIKVYTLPIIIDYANLCLEDGWLTEEEISNITLLKLFLGVKEGDFYRNTLKNDVRNVLLKHLRLLYADGQITPQEALLMSNMQGLFGLSFSEYEEIIKEIE